MAITTSPDEHILGVLTKSLKVLIYDKLSGKSFLIPQIDAKFFDPTELTFEVMLNMRMEKERKGTQSAWPHNEYNLYVSNRATSIFVISKNERLVLLWKKSLDNEKKRAEDLNDNKKG